MLDPNSEYVEIGNMHSPKKMLKLIGKTSKYGALPRLEKNELRDCQYDAEINFENSLRNNKNKSLAVLATGSGKTYLACLASYRLLNYTPVDRVLFLVDRNNLAKQTESEFSTFDRTENGLTLSSLYYITRLRKTDDIKGDVVISTIQKLYSVLTGNNIIDDMVNLSWLERKCLQVVGEENRIKGVNMANEVCKNYRREGRFFDEILESALNGGNKNESN